MSTSPVTSRRRHSRSSDPADYPRQLSFLIDGLLDRLIYLTYGLAVILAFIGVKLILHALHENNLPFINDGEHVNVLEISTGLWLSASSGSW